MEFPDDIGVDENEVLRSEIRSLQPPSIFLDKSKKSFIKRKRHGTGILAELEPISEMNTLSDFDLSSRGNYSLVEYIRNKKKPENISKSFTYNSNSNLSFSSILDSSTISLPTSSDTEERRLTESEELLQTTPPGILRQRIKEAKDAESSLQKELKELMDFTTAERQILSVEKGYDALQEENSYLKLEFETIQDMNSNLKMEVEKTKKLSDSQQNLINNLQGNFDKVQSELNNCVTEKGELAKELEKIKIQLTDEVYKNELNQNKFKKREDELKKSLEEAWAASKVKDERLIKINEKVGLLCNERELRANSNVADLYNLSISHFENQTSSIFPESDKCTEYPIDNEKENITALHIDLQKLQREFENQKYELDNLKDILNKKEKDIQYIDDGLNKLSFSFVFHKHITEDIEIGSELCTIEHKDLLEKISCEFSHHCLKFTPSAEEETIKQDFASLQTKSDSGLGLDGVVKDISSTDISSNALNIILTDVHNKQDNSCKDEDAVLIQSYIERISVLEKELSHIKNKAESDIYSSPKDLENPIQCDISCQTNLDFISLHEYEQRIALLEKEIQNKTSERMDSCCQTIPVNNDIENISFTSITKVNKCINCSASNIYHKSTQVEINNKDASFQTCNMEVFTVDGHLNNTSQFLRDSDSGKSVESQASLDLLTSVEMETDSDTISDVNDIEIEEPNTSDSYDSSRVTPPKVKSVRDVFIQTVDESFNSFACNACLLNLQQTPATKHSVGGRETDSSVLICETDPLSEDNSLLNTKTSEDYSTISTETTFESTSEIFNPEKSIDNMHIPVYNTSVLENNLSITSSRQNTVFCEFIDLPAVDTTVFDSTFNYLEHSILKSKLSSFDVGVSETCDPLATESEVAKPIVEIPFIHALNLMSESKILENKCKALTEELASKNLSNTKSLSLLAEFNNLIHPTDLSSEYDIIKNSEETLSLFNAELDILKTCGQYKKTVGLLPTLKKVKSVFNSLINLLNNVQSLKKDHLSMVSHVKSLEDINNDFLNITVLLSDLPENVEINNDNNSTLVKENLENLLHENKELKEQLLKLKTLNSDLKETSALYDDLLRKHSELHTILEDKDKSIKEISDFKNIYISFIKNIEGIQLIKEHTVSNEEIFSKSCSSQFLNKIEKCLINFSNTCKVLENFNFGTNDLTKVIETLYTEKCDLEKYNNVLKCNIDSVRKKILIFNNICYNYKSNLKTLKYAMVDIKNTFTQDLMNINIDIEKNIKNKLEPLNELYHENISLKSKIDEVSDRYSQLVISHEKLQNEFNLNQSSLDAIKSNLTSIVNENSDLKSKITKSESDSFDKSIEIENLQQGLKKLESDLLVSKEKHIKLLQNQEETFSCKYDKIDLEKKELETEISECQNKIISLEQENKSLKELKKDSERRNLEFEQLLNENESLKTKINSYDSLILTNEKYSDLYQKHTNLLEECSKYKNNCDYYLGQINILNATINELKSEINVLKTNNSTLLDKLTEYDLLIIDQERYRALSESLQHFNKFINNSEDTLTGCLLENTKFISENVFVSTKEIFSNILSMRQKLKELNQSLINVNDEKTELINNLQSLNYEIEMSLEANIFKDEEKNNLIKNEQEQSKQLREIIDKYDHEILDVLTILGHKGAAQVSDESWLFIKQNIKSHMNRTGDESKVVLELQGTIHCLESQLSDTDHFKRKLSKELNGLKPDLKVLDLMKMSLEELYTTMLSTIIEKEMDVVSNLRGDYENKLADSSDRIQQLEEEVKRNVDWIKEIENENDRLQNDYKQIQNDNENLKSEIRDKVQNIVTLQEKIESQKDNADKSLLYDSIIAKYDQEQNQKSFNESGLQKKIIDLNNKLDEKCSECQNAFDSLQDKSGRIFHLENLNSNLQLAKSHLEDEVKRLKDEMNNQLSIFTDNRKELEIEIETNKTLLKVFTDSSNKVSYPWDIEASDLVKFLEKICNDADSFLKHNISNLFENHTKKIDKLNIRVKELSIQLNKQNSKFVELKNKEHIIENLEVEASPLKSENSDINKLEVSLDENLLLRKEISELKNKLTVIKEEREALVQASVDTQASFKDEISALNDNLKLCQSELESYKNEYVKIKDEKDKISEEIESLNMKILKSSENIKFIQEENIKLKEQSKDYLRLENEHSKLCSSFQECNLELKMLKESQEQLLKTTSEYSNTKEELDVLNSTIIKYQNEIEHLKNEKESMTKKLLDNLEFEKSVHNSTKMELIKKENDILSLQRENDTLLKDLNTYKQNENLKAAGLENEIDQIKEINNNLNLALSSLKKKLQEKDVCIQNLQTELNSITSKFHSEDSCPFRKESMENKKLADEFNKLLTQERETFKQWKTIMEEDIQCKVLFIRDLETKLLKETQINKDERLSHSDLQCKLHETESKIKKLEDKITMQREVFIKDKSKLEHDIHEKENTIKSLDDKITAQREVFMKEKSKLAQEIKMKELNEQRFIDLKHKTEEFVDSYNVFLEKVSSTFNKNIPDLATVYVEINRIFSALEEEKENVKQLDEECEILNTNIKHLENELGKLFMSDEDDRNKLNQEKAKLQNEQAKNEKMINELKVATETVTLLKAEIATLSSQYERDRKAYEININNLLEDKKKIQMLYSNLEQKVSSLQSTKEDMLRKDNHKIEELMKEINHLKLQIVTKSAKIANLEMRLEVDCLPFKKKYETAEKKVEELSKELRTLKHSLNSRETISAATSPYSIKVNSESSKRIEEYIDTITRLQEEVKKLEKDKYSLKKIAVMRHREIRELQERLGIVSLRESSLQDSHK